MMKVLTVIICSVLLFACGNKNEDSKSEEKESNKSENTKSLEEYAQEYCDCFQDARENETSAKSCDPIVKEARKVLGDDKKDEFLAAVDECSMKEEVGDEEKKSLEEYAQDYCDCFQLAKEEERSAQDCDPIVQKAKHHYGDDAKEAFLNAVDACSK